MDVGGKHVVVIVNPKAGAGRAAGRAHIVDALRGHFVRNKAGKVDVLHSEYPGHATALAAQARIQGAASVVAVGGDGTTFEVINGWLAEDPHAASSTKPSHAQAGPHSFLANRAPLGLVPAGTGNSLLRDFGIETIADAIAAIEAGKTQPCDVVEAVHAEGRFVYANLLSMGLGARAGDLTNRRFKSFGAAGYAVATLCALATHRHETQAFQWRRAQASHEHEAEGALLSLSNSRCTGGAMQMAPRASVNDGLLDIVHVGALSRWGIFQSFPKIYRGTHIEVPGIRTWHAEEVILHAPHMQPVMVDGEVLQIALSSATIRKHALQVFA